ncbi:MAG: hypothetical protein HY078_05270 [Elusimicrobia bacterium]|nr:hypothetical protein [Elusimicrobiota bacterium]
MPDKPRKFGESGSESGVATPDLPEFKKKEDERKGSGVPFIARSSGSVNVVGTMGRSAGSGSGFLGSSRLAAILSEAFGGPSSLIGSMFASKYGSLLAIVVAISAAVGFIAAGMLLHDAMNGKAAPQPEPQTFDAPAAPVKATSPARTRGTPSGLFYLSKDELTKAAADLIPAAEMTDDKKAPAEAKEKAPAPAAPQAPAAAQQQLRKLNANFKELSTGGSAGSRLVSALQNAVPKLETSNKITGGGKLAALQPPAQKRQAGAASVQRGSSHRAMGQLKLARTMSTSAATTTGSDAARTYAADAFDQRKTLGGAALSNAGSDPIVPPGAGLPAGGGSGISVGQNQTPYQNDVNDAQNQGNKAKNDKTLAMVLLGIGALLLMLGMMMMQNPATQEMGTMLLMMGIMMLIAGAIAMANANKAKNNAQQKAQQVGDQKGQKEQGKALNDCIDQAWEQGKNMEDCHRAQKFELPKNNVHKDVQEEREADYKL